MKKRKADTHTEIVRLIEEHKNLLYKVVNSYCSDVHEQEDLIQEIIFHILKGYRKFDHKVKVTTWMYKVAFNVSISHYRKVKSRQKYIVPMPEKLVSITDTEPVETDENIHRLRAFIQSFDPLNKALVILYLDGNSHAEIARVLGISVSNVGTKINRIKQQLRKKFNP
ncbi:MAG: sigma-70 family RNA polymerase sigma factor [Bacteroidales bacterium]|nr:sigma-70 family RNA polymerase sigma factor [Bacteroidales bacterium]